MKKEQEEILVSTCKELYKNILALQELQLNTPFDSLINDKIENFGIEQKKFDAYLKGIIRENKIDEILDDEDIREEEI